MECTISGDDLDYLIWSTPYGDLIHSFPRLNNFRFRDDHEGNPIFSSNAKLIEDGLESKITFTPHILLNNTEIFCYTTNETGKKCSIKFEPNNESTTKQGYFLLYHVFLFFNTEISNANVIVPSTIILVVAIIAGTCIMIHSILVLLYWIKNKLNHRDVHKMKEYD